ncbi:hypothetical protein THOM_1527 [Trachipleistophora hominis]|uniref:Uncharacterized protein n=1 Tax=Trachipleistophora hominis TaxID=72359 RepID=L7JVH6_TRAHO|nr:hypothetical protein THOM_1527 [Trachipleistophora hominis]
MYTNISLLFFTLTAYGYELFGGLVVNARRKGSAKLKVASLVCIVVDNVTLLVMPGTLKGNTKVILFTCVAAMRGEYPVINVMNRL